MTPHDAQQRQHGEQEAQLLDGPSERDARPLNADAERALLRVRQKLKGLEGGALQNVQHLLPALHCPAQTYSASQVCESAALNHICTQEKQVQDASYHNDKSGEVILNFAVVSHVCPLIVAPAAS